MSSWEIRLGVILAITAVLLISGCSLTVMPTPPPETTVNHPPEISDLILERMQVLPSTSVSPSIIEVRCVASDPDGDAISYEWSTTGGKFTGSGGTVSWVAPENLGNYEVKVTVKDGRGGSAVASVTISVVPNRDPEILSLIAEPPKVSPGERVSITCVARDPDDDTLTYVWRPSAGNIIGTGDVVTWIAPDRGGQFIVTAIVSDGRGGQNAAQVSIEVFLAERVVTFNLVPNESGTVTSKGEKNTSYLKAGDNERNVGYRAFFSFDITQLRGKKIKDAKLSFTTNNVYGNPFSKEPGVGLEGLQIVLVRGAYGGLPDYDADVERLTKAVQVMWKPPTVIDVTSEVTSALLRPGIVVHIQFEARFVLKTNNNHVADYVDWALATLTVSYEE